MGICTTCKGRGRLVEDTRWMEGLPRATSYKEFPCPVCLGSGAYFENASPPEDPPKHRCEYCLSGVNPNECYRAYGMNFCDEGCYTRHYD